VFSPSTQTSAPVGNEVTFRLPFAASSVVEDRSAATDVYRQNRGTGLIKTFLLST
jgi:hypothetical protein